jgi:hypothetical protein
MPEVLINSKGFRVQYCSFWLCAQTGGHIQAWGVSHHKLYQRFSVICLDLIFLEHYKFVDSSFNEYTANFFSSVFVFMCPKA